MRARSLAEETPLVAINGSISLHERGAAVELVTGADRHPLLAGAWCPHRMPPQEVSLRRIRSHSHPCKCQRYVVGPSAGRGGIPRAALLRHPRSEAWGTIPAMCTSPL